MGKAPKYVSAAYLAERTSLTTRWFTGQACEGKIPGAVQPAGPGGAWRFDEDQFWRWWGEKEPFACLDRSVAHRPIDRYQGLSSRHIQFNKPSAKPRRL